MPGTFTNLNYHIVFSTKHRIPQIKPEWRQRMYDYIGGIIRNEGGVLYDIGGMADHIHILTRIPPTTSISNLLCDIKDCVP